MAVLLSLIVLLVTQFAAASSAPQTPIIVTPRFAYQHSIAIFYLHVDEAYPNVTLCLLNGPGQNRYTAQPKKVDLSSVHHSNPVLNASSTFVCNFGVLHEVGSFSFRADVPGVGDQFYQTVFIVHAMRYSFLHRSHDVYQGVLGQRFNISVDFFPACCEVFNALQPSLLLSQTNISLSSTLDPALSVVYNESLTYQDHYRYVPTPWTVGSAQLSLPLMCQAVSNTSIFLVSQRFSVLNFSLGFCVGNTAGIGCVLQADIKLYPDADSSVRSVSGGFVRLFSVMDAAKSTIHITARSWKRVGNTDNMYVCFQAHPLTRMSLPRRLSTLMLQAENFLLDIVSPTGTICGWEEGRDPASIGKTSIVGLPLGNRFRLSIGPETWYEWTNNAFDNGRDVFVVWIWTLLGALCVFVLVTFIVRRTCPLSSSRATTNGTKLLQWKSRHRLTCCVTVSEAQNNSLEWHHVVVFDCIPSVTFAVWCAAGVLCTYRLCLETPEWAGSQPLEEALLGLCVALWVQPAGSLLWLASSSVVESHPREHNVYLVLSVVLSYIPATIVSLHFKNALYGAGIIAGSSLLHLELFSCFRFFEKTAPRVNKMTCVPITQKACKKRTNFPDLSHHRVLLCFISASSS